MRLGHRERMWTCWGPLFRTTACLSTSRIYCERPPQLMCVFSFFSVKENHCSQELSLNALSIYKIYSTEISVKNYTMYKRVWTFMFLRSFRNWNFQRDIYRKIGKNSKSFFCLPCRFITVQKKKIIVDLQQSKFRRGGTGGLVHVRTNSRYR